MIISKASYNIKSLLSDNVIVLIGLLLLVPIMFTYANYNSGNLIPIILIPIVYCILFVISFKFIGHIFTPGLLVANALYLLRYYLLPLTTIVYMPNQYISSFISGTWLLLYEEIFLSIVLYYFLKREKHSQFAKIDSTTFKREFKLILLLFSFLCMVCIIFYIIDPSVYKSFNLITNVGNDFVEMIEENASKTESSSFRTLELIVIYLTYLMLAVCIVLFFYSKYQKRKSNIYFLLALILPLIASAIIIIDTDRGGIVHRGAAILFLLFRLFPEKRKVLVNAAYIPMGVLVLYLIASRMLGNDNGGSSVLSAEEFFVYYMQGYLAGIQNCTEAIQTYIQFGSHVGPETLFNDLFTNVPVMSHFTGKNACSKFFATVINQDDQVFPLVGNGLMYFGYLLSPIFSILTIKVLLVTERKYRNETSIFGAYVFSYIAIQLAFSHYQNIQLIMLYLTCRILPIWLVYKFVRNYTKKNKKLA